MGIANMETFRPLPIERLQVEVYSTCIDMGNAAAYDEARKMKEFLVKKERIRMIFAAATSQNEFLKRLVHEEGVDWSRVTVFQMDEYIGLTEDDPRRFSRFLTER